jgi:prepilin-type N-terminal cleavage/methylation domain-containing protein
MKKGFTLVEVLIVVVIIAILAALTVPRMLAQTKRAVSAEATQMIGAMKRVAARNWDLGVSGNIDIATGANSWGVPEATAQEWESTGLKKPASPNWVYEYYYSYDSHDYAGVAFYKNDTNIHQYYYKYDGGEDYYCGDGMTYIDENNPMLGCRLS